MNNMTSVEANRNIANLKILIADDDEVSRIFLGMLVEMFAKEIIYAENGLEAVVACQDKPDIDLILMDIKMPKMDGYEATRQIRQTNKEVIITQSAYSKPSDIDKAKQAGSNDFITKPIDEWKIRSNWVLRHIWGCFILCETKSPFSLITQSLPYHTFVA